MELIPIMIFLFLIVITVPIGIALFLGAFVGFAFFSDLPLITVGQAMFTKLDKFALLTVLCFILAGNYMTKGVIASKIVNLSQSILGHIKGGISIACVLANGLFGAISGSTLATLAAIGGIGVPTMKKQGLPAEYAVSLMTASSILGIIVPPSIPMILYCMITDVSIARLFMAGFLPAIIIILLISLYCYFKERSATGVLVSSFNLAIVRKSIKEGIWAIFMPLIIFGGIFSGIFTPTEAAVAAAVYAILVEMLVYRELSIRKMLQITFESGVSVGSIMIITAGSLLMSDYLAYQQVPDRISAWIATAVSNKYLFLLIMNVFLLLLGMLLEVVAIIMIVTPILFPVAMAIGLDPIQLGIIMIVNVGIGYITPPVGVACFLSSSMFNMPVPTIFKSIMPLLIIWLVSLAMITFVPAISTIVPDLFMAP